MKAGEPTVGGPAASPAEGPLRWDIIELLFFAYRDFVGDADHELEAFGSDKPRSNGRAVIRSTDAGATFTDMTNDAGGPPTGMHPDQHAMAFDPAHPDIWFIGSDGGMIRSDGAYRDGSSVCAPRGLTGAMLTFCQQVTSVVPHRLDNINTGLKTLQFQGLAVDQTGATDGGRTTCTWLSFLLAIVVWTLTCSSSRGSMGIVAVCALWGLVERTSVSVCASCPGRT